MSPKMMSLSKRFVEDRFAAELLLRSRQAAQRLATKRSKIASAIMGEVKSFFEQDAYVNRPDQVKAYVSWALQPDGPAFHETPTPSTCTFKRDHQEYIVSPHFDSSADSQPVALAPKRHISTTYHEQRCKALSPSSQGVGSGSANQRLKSTKGTLWASARFCMLFNTSTPLVLIACNRSSVPSLLSSLGSLRNQRRSFLTRITGLSLKPTWATSTPCNQHYGRKFCIEQIHRMYSILRKVTLPTTHPPCQLVRTFTFLICNEIVFIQPLSFRFQSSNNGLCSPS